jgi:hypothetical protein
MKKTSNHTNHTGSAKTSTAGPLRPVVPSDQSRLLALAQEDSARGFEEATRQDFAVPFLNILQSNSPQVKPKTGGYIPGAQPGMIFNSVNHHLYESVRVIPCYFQPLFIEWIPRSKGGGFVTTHPATTPLRDKAIRDGASNLLPNGHELTYTAQHFVLVLDDEGAEGALITMKSTQLKYSRRWMSLMKAATLPVEGQLIQPAMWAFSYEATTAEETNDKGTWYGWQISDRQQVEDLELYMQARAFNNSMKAGAVRVNYEELQRQESADDERMAKPGDLNNEIDA